MTMGRTIRFSASSDRLPLRHAPVILCGAIEEGLDVAAEGEFFGEVGGFVELAAQALGLGQIVFAKADLDLELRILLGEGAHPLLDLTAAIAIAGSLFQ